MRVLIAVIFTAISTFGTFNAAHAFKNSAEVEAYIKKNRDAKMPDGYQLPLGFCADDDELCNLQSASTLKDLKAAYKKNYGAQRNVAFCLSTGCDGGVQINETLGCAWRIVILASGSLEIQSGDHSHLKICLNKMDGAQLATAKAQAASLYRTIYKREISPDWQ